MLAVSLSWLGPRHEVTNACCPRQILRTEEGVGHCQPTWPSKRAAAVAGLLSREAALASRPSTDLYAGSGLSALPRSPSSPPLCLGVAVELRPDSGLAPPGSALAARSEAAPEGGNWSTLQGLLREGGAWVCDDQVRGAHNGLQSAHWPAGCTWPCCQLGLAGPRRPSWAAGAAFPGRVSSCGLLLEWSDGQPVSQLQLAILRGGFGAQQGEQDETARRSLPAPEIKQLEAVLTSSRQEGGCGGTAVARCHLA